MVFCSFFKDEDSIYKNVSMSIFLANPTVQKTNLTIQPAAQ